MRRILSLFIVLALCSCAPHQSTDAYSDTQFLMDTVCTIRAGGKDAQEAISASFNKIAKLDALADYYSPTSEVTRINNSPANTDITLSNDIYNILLTALDVCEKSNGAFDITVAPLKDLWDFSSGDHIPPSEVNISNALNSVDYTQLTLDKETKVLRKSTDICKIDLSSVVKGYAADCVAQILSEHSINYALIDLGGNIYTFGKNPNREDGKWLIGIQKPFSNSDEFSQTVLVSSGAVVTSGIYQRYFKWDEKIYHHILDTKTGYPSNSGLFSATIKSDSAAIADCLSTACMTLGEEKGLELVSKYNAELIVERNTL